MTDDDDLSPSRRHIRTLNPRAKLAPCFVVIRGESLGRAHALPAKGELLTIGRARENEIHVDDNSVSRRHTEIRVDDFGVKLRDLGSANGTYVNDTRVQDAYLCEGDLIEIGSTVIKFVGGDEAQYHRQIHQLLAAKDADDGSSS
jgi:pSer/pThr/pTyr-binding forkhead associated (FHA) protein